MIGAVDDDFTAIPVNGYAGGAAGDLIDNDTLNAAAVLDTEIVITLTGDSNMSIAPSVDSNGTLLIAANTPEGTYYVEYQICENLNPSNCDEANASIVILNDFDHDGIPDAIDLDDDNDGILDTVELATAKNGGDTDGDGLPDNIDLDSDNDGILDLEESNAHPASVDSNGDGVLDSTTDADHDGVMDSADMDDSDASSEGTVTPIDTDGDGTPDFQDIDSDNDGLSDLIEGGSSALLDTDNNGMLDNVTDSDRDGISDSVDPDNGGTPATTPDTDGDGVDNYRDLDSDNDGLDDVIEAGGSDSDKNGLHDTSSSSLLDPLTDTDNNGVADALEPNNPNLPGAIDTDGDGIIDDTTDSDHDGIPNVTDGTSNNFSDAPQLDSDNDGIPDVYDIDDDNDGIPDVAEGSADLDTDGDGVIDRLDLDSDNDGIADIVEAGGIDSDLDGRVDAPADNDNDGLADIVDSAPNSVDHPTDIASGSAVTRLDIPDTDGDGARNFQDVDSDNDGLSDLYEGGKDPATWDQNNNGMIDLDPDEDHNGIADNVDTDGIAAGLTFIAPLPNHDLDPVPDYLDLDSDNDGLNDVSEAGGVDKDANGILDAGQTLTDPMAQPDENSNGTTDPYEPPVATVLPVNVDADQDGVIDDITDDDGDGIPNVTDVVDNVVGTGVVLHATDNLDIPISHIGGNVIDVLANGDSYTILSNITYTQPSHGSVGLDDNGTPGDPSDDVLIYTPEPDYIGDDSFTYTIYDPSGNTSTATVTLRVDCASSQTSDSSAGDALGLLGSFWMIFMTLAAGAILIRKEEELNL